MKQVKGVGNRHHQSERVKEAGITWFESTIQAKFQALPHAVWMQYAMNE